MSWKAATLVLASWGAGELGTVPSAFFSIASSCCGLGDGKPSDLRAMGEAVATLAKAARVAKRREKASIFPESRVLYADIARLMADLGSTRQDDVADYVVYGYYCETVVFVMMNRNGVTETRLSWQRPPFLFILTIHDVAPRITGGIRCYGG